MALMDLLPGRDGGVNEFEVPKDKKALILWLENKRKQGRSTVPERAMKLNLAFVLGHQWLLWDTSTNTFRRPALNVRQDDPNAPVRITINKIGSLVERIVAKLTKSAPIPEARPVSDDEKDITAAVVATRILAHEMDRLEWRSWLTEFLFWPGALGYSFAQIVWDPDQGEQLAEDEEGQPIRLGDVDLTIVPANELAVDPSSRRGLRDAKWAIRDVVMSREAVWEEWGVRVPGEENARSLVDEIVQMAAQHERKQDTGWVTVHQLWMLPSRAAPKGMVVTWTGEHILEQPKDFPYEHGMLPFEEMPWLPKLGGAFGRTWVDDLISPQMDYNDARSREATIRRTLTPKVLAPAGSMDPQRMTSRVEVLTYNPVGQPPQYFMPDAGWTQQYETSMMRADSELGSRAGVNEASQGQAGASTPAAAILALQEADDTKLAVTATMLAGFTAAVGKQVLLLTRQFWTEERTVRVFSEEAGALDVFRYRGADVGRQLDIRVASESALPKSKSARVQLALELHARQIIPSTQDLLRMLDLPGTEFLVRDLDLDTRKQKRELAYMLQTGEPAEVAEFDNHAIHIEQLNRFRKTEEYEKLPDRIKANIDAHAAVHMELVLRQAGVPMPVTSAPYDQLAGGAAAAVKARSARGKVGGGGYLMDPGTGMPPDPLMIASGQAPSPVTDKGIYNQAGIGQGAGSPGRVPGVPADNQAASMGA